MTSQEIERRLLDAFLFNGWPMTEGYVKRHCIHMVQGNRELWLHDGLVFLALERRDENYC